MHEFKHLIPKNTPTILSHGACELIKNKAVEDDVRSRYFTIGNAYVFQFWAHHGLDSAGEGRFRINRYDSLQNAQGVYPERRDSVLLSREGYFRLSKSGGLPTITFDGANPENPVELAVDAHRVNENPILSAFHLMACKLHNRRMDDHGDYELAKKETVSLLNRISLNEALILCDMEEHEFFNDIVIENFHMSAEFVFAVARWAHPMMSETVAGRALFTPMASELVDLKAMFDGSEMARDLNFGTSSAMLNMDHLPGGIPSILDRTFAKHQEVGLACWQDLCEAYGHGSEIYGDGPDRSPAEDSPGDLCQQGAPIFAGMLYEAEHHGGKPGTVLRRALADGLAGSLGWGKDFAQGLWFPLWSGAPRTTIDIIEYANG